MRVYNKLNPLWKVFITIIRVIRYRGKINTASNKPLFARRNWNRKKCLEDIINRPVSVREIPREQQQFHRKTEAFYYVPTNDDTTHVWHNINSNLFPPAWLFWIILSRRLYIIPITMSLLPTYPKHHIFSRCYFQKHFSLRESVEEKTVADAALASFYSTFF